MRQFLHNPQDHGGPRAALAPVVPDYVDARVLAANTSEVFAIPAGARYVVFSFTADFWAKFGTSGVTAAVPSADMTDGAAPELNPAARRIPDGITHLALVAEAAVKGSLSFFG